MHKRPELSSKEGAVSALLEQDARAELHEGEELVRPAQSVDLDNVLVPEDSTENKGRRSAPSATTSALNGACARECVRACVWARGNGNSRTEPTPAARVASRRKSPICPSDPSPTQAVATLYSSLEASADYPDSPADVRPGRSGWCSNRPSPESSSCHKIKSEASVAWRERERKRWGEEETEGEEVRDRKHTRSECDEQARASRPEETPKGSTQPTGAASDASQAPASASKHAAHEAAALPAALPQMT